VLTYLWALTSTDRSGLARAIAWQDADTDDWQRFPARPIAAAAEPFQFRTAVWPGLETIEVPTDHGVVERDLDEFMAETGTTAFLVLHGDELLTERYYNGASRDSVMTSFSMAKSFLSALVGIAIAEGSIGSVDDPITKYCPSWLSGILPSPESRSVTCSACRRGSHTANSACRGATTA